MTFSERLMSTILSVIGGAVGGFVGYKAFSWLYDHGYYGMMIPGGLLGLGCGMLARHPSQVRGSGCRRRRAVARSLHGMAILPLQGRRQLLLFADTRPSNPLGPSADDRPRRLLRVLAGQGWGLGKDNSPKSGPDAARSSLKVYPGTRQQRKRKTEKEIRWKNEEIVESCRARYPRLSFFFFALSFRTLPLFLACFFPDRL